MDGAREIGRIVRVQVQDRSLKVPGPRFRAYDPAGIVRVAALELDEGGATGIAAGGTRVHDVHHRDHPASKFRGDNGLSIGFTSHYGTMRAMFPGGIDDGQAGENLLVETDRTWSGEDLALGLVALTADGPVRLERVIVADPCVEFARWLLDYPPEERPDASVGAAVAFLADGVRGFYAAWGGGPARIAEGDLLAIASGG